MRVVWIGIVVMCATRAQFRNLAVTDDAGQLYFTAAQPLKAERAVTPVGSTAPGLYRILRGEDGNYDAPELFARPQRSTGLTSRTRATVSVSGAGTVVKWADSTHDNCGAPCNRIPATVTTFVARPDRNPPQSWSGFASLSRNGRFLLLQTTASLLDLSTNTALPITDAEIRAGISLCTPRDDGRLLCQLQDRLVLWDGRSSEVIARLPLALLHAVLSADANTLAYIEYPSQLTVLDIRRQQIVLRSELDIPLVAEADRPAFTNDGAHMIFTRAVDGFRQLFFVDIRQGVSPQGLPPIPGGVQSWALAGFGKYVFAVGGETGNLVEIAVESGATRHLLVGPAVMTFGPLAPGGLLNAYCPGGILLDGKAAASLGDGKYQLPWTLQPDSDVEVMASSESFFGDVSVERVQRRVPQFEIPRIAHPKSGQIFSFWGYGLGAVTPQVPEGHQAPQSPLSTLVEPLRCAAVPIGSDSGVEVEVLFAGLAPGMAGVYQVNIRTPNTVPERGIILCQDAAPVAPQQSAFVIAFITPD